MIQIVHRAGYRAKVLCVYVCVSHSEFKYQFYDFILLQKYEMTMFDNKIRFGVHTILHALN